MLYRIIALLCILFLSGSISCRAGNAEEFGSWSVRKKVDSIDGNVFYVAEVEGKDGSLEHGIGCSCQDQMPFIFFLAGKMWFRVNDISKERAVIVRFDSGPPQQQIWYCTSAAVSTWFIVVEDAAQRFADIAKKATRVELRAMIDNETVTRIYPLDGFTKAISKIPCFR
jgi:hypothetical protein